LSEDAALDERRQWVDCPALALAPPIVAAMWTGRHGLALALFMIAAATDVLDGAAARRSARRLHSART